MEKLEELLATITPVDFDALSFFKMIVIASIACFLLGLIMRLIFGKRSGLNHSICSAIGILMIYIVSIALFCLGSPYDQFMTPLPFVSFAGEYMSIFVLEGAGTSAICAELIRMMLLAFLVNLIDSLVPRGKKFFGWLLLRCVSVVAGIAGQWLIKIGRASCRERVLR